MWKEVNNTLEQEFVFKDFKEAFAFMTKVADIANELDHHPEWSNVYNKVSIKLTTHDAGNTITEKDREMGRRIEEMKVNE